MKKNFSWFKIQT